MTKKDKQTADTPEIALSAEPAEELPAEKGPETVIPVPVQSRPSLTVTNRGRKRVIVNTNSGNVLSIAAGGSATILAGEETSPEIVGNPNLRVK